MPHSFGGTEFVEQVDSEDFGQAARVVLCGAADGVQVHGAEFLERGEGPLAHAAFAHHPADAVALDDVRFVGFFADAGGRSGSGSAPADVGWRPFLHHHGAAVIENRAAQVARSVVVEQVVVQGVAAGDDRAVDEHHVADSQRAHLIFGERRLETYLAAGQLEGRALADQPLDRPVGIAVEPLLDGPGLGVEHHAQAAERPAIVGDGDEKARGQAIGGGDLTADERRFSAKAHRAHADLVGFLHDFGFELGERGIGVRVVERTEELLLGDRVAVRAVAADAHADGARRAALALRLPHRVQDALARALEVAVGAPQVVERRGQRVLDVLVLAAAAFQDHAHLDVGLFPLLEVHYGRSRAEVIAGVLARDGVNRVGPQLAAPRRFGHRFLDPLSHHYLIGAHRSLDLKSDEAGVLADGTFVLVGHVNVFADDGERLAGLRPGLLAFECHAHRLAHVRRQVRRSLDEEFEHRFAEDLHRDLPRQWPDAAALKYSLPESGRDLHLSRRLKRSSRPARGGRQPTPGPGHR